MGLIKLRELLGIPKTLLKFCYICLVFFQFFLYCKMTMIKLMKLLNSSNKYLNSNTNLDSMNKVC